MDKLDEVLFIFVSLLLFVQVSDVICFFYKGLVDDKECYYCIVWFDQVFSDVQCDNVKCSVVVMVFVCIGIILVVVLCQVNYCFQYVNGFLINIGNVILWIFVYGFCLKVVDGKECKENYYLMLGKLCCFMQVNMVDKKGWVVFWQGEQFVFVKQIVVQMDNDDVFMMDFFRIENVVCFWYDIFVCLV